MSNLLHLTVFLQFLLSLMTLSLHVFGYLFLLEKYLFLLDTYLFLTPFTLM